VVWKWANQVISCLQPVHQVAQKSTRRTLRPYALSSAVFRQNPPEQKPEPICVPQEKEGSPG
jgi:hypothetical protein